MYSQSIGTGRVTDGELTLRPNAASADNSPESEQFYAHHVVNVNSNLSDDKHQNSQSQAGTESSVAGRTEQSIIGYEEPIMLTQSTHSFMFTEPTNSVPFLFSFVIIGISYACLLLALFNNIYEDNGPGNFFNVPVGVTIDVKIAQYLALLVGLIMEEEIPESLYLLRMITKTTLHNRAPDLKFRRFIFCAIIRIIMGYLFYLNMFTVVAQADRVIDIFYDVMALQFLQQVDDIAFKLAKWDVFGKKMKRASTRKCFRAEFEKLPFARRKKVSIFVKVLYIINLCAMMIGLTIISLKQHSGEFQCGSISVVFDDHIWENALVNSPDGVEEMDLIYSYFNGVYVKNGTHDGRPVYTEQNKFDDERYEHKIGAKIQYCNEEKAWVFMHENIRKDINTAKSDCPWLLRSPDTKSFNLLEVDSTWAIWTGIITTGATFQATCNTCDSEAECNYHGTCTEGVCDCDLEVDGYAKYAGIHCQFPRPCLRVNGTKGDVWDIISITNEENEVTTWKAYGRGVYMYNRWISKENHDVPLGDGLLLLYSGSRWFGTHFEGADSKGRDYWLRYSREMHAFWDRVYQENTNFVSNPTSRSDPIAVDFFEIMQRGEKYGPLGKLFPVQDPPGSGYFECSTLNMRIDEFIAEQQGNEA